MANPSDRDRWTTYLATTAPPGLLEPQPGGAIPGRSGLPPQPWPTADDVAAARDYKRRFGNTNEQMIDKGLLANQIPGSAVTEFDQREQAGNQRWQQTPIDQPTADVLYGGQIAAQRSPLGYLGYDVNRMVVTPPHEGETPFDLAGAQYPGTDRIWTDLNYPSNPVHESIHRGVSQLRKQGIAISPSIEEALVRAEMLKHYGDVEKSSRSEIEQGRQVLNDPATRKVLDRIEQQANDEIARRNLAKGPL